MIRLLKYLKSSFILVILIICLLILQAFLDLTLPDYTAKIVDVGISQGGIENAAIEEIGESTYNELKYLMNHDDALVLEENYSYKYYFNGENIYTLNPNADIDKVSKVMLEPMNILNMLESPEFAKENNMESPINIYHYIGAMDAKQLEMFNKTITEEMAKYPDTFLMQGAITFINKEYERIEIDTDQFQTSYILKTGIIMILITLSAALVGIAVIYLSAKVAATLAKNLRNKVYSKVLKMSKDDVTKIGTASLITRTTNDIQQVQSVMAVFFKIVIYAPIIAVGGVIKASNTNNEMLDIILYSLIAILLLMMILFTFALPKFKKIQSLIDKLNLVARESLAGISIIRAFSNQKQDEEKFEKTNDALTKNNKSVLIIMSFMMPMMMLILNITVLAIVYFGAKSVDLGTMQVGDIMAFIQYTMQIIMAFVMISVMAILLPRANISAKRINEVLTTKINIKTNKKSKNFDKTKKGLVEFKNVSFKYSDADYDTISDVTFTAKPGQITAFVGSTGSGKSTIVNLMPRFFDTTSGEIFIDGINIKEANLESLRNKIGLVPQKGILFSKTIKENIKFANRKINDTDISNALEIAQAKSFVSSFKDKINHKISQDGSNVSGGQRQRLAIARAIAKNPDILIFDDSFSALDYKTDVKVRKALQKQIKDKTVFIVAQRISTIKDADNIIVLNEGSIVGSGKHHELLKSCNVYKEIANSQLNEEEEVI